MYFIDEFHEKNYTHLVNMVFRANKDSEYRTISYILAVPDIYARCINDPMLHEFPFLWRYEYKDTSYVDKDEEGEYNVIDFEVAEDEEGNPRISREYGTMSHGFKLLVELGLNLFNSSNDDFNLMNALSTWDDRLVKIYYQAVAIRLEGRKEIEGLTLIIK